MWKRLFCSALTIFCIGAYIPHAWAAEQPSETILQEASPAPPAIPTSGDKWDGVTVTQPKKLVKKDGLNYYEITKCSELAFVARTSGEWMGRNYLLANDLILNDVVLQWDANGSLINDLDTLHEWTPLGSSLQFSGIFDGNGHTVSGLYVGDSDCSGLFAYNTGTVKSLTVVNASIDGGTYVGGIIGENADRGAHVSDCVFSGLVRGIHYVGGVVGESSRSDCVNCVNYGTIIGTSIDPGYGNTGSIGGVVGGEYSSGSHIIKCVNYGPVTGNVGVGGVAGSLSHYSNTIVSNCANYGSVIGTKSGGGGIASGGNVYFSVNYGTVTGGPDGFAGGIICDGNATNCANHGSVIGGRYAGGIAALSNGRSIVNCYNTASVTGTTGVGGIAGLLDKATITNCYNIGNVTGTGSDTKIAAIAGSDGAIWGKDTVTGCFYLKNSKVNTNLYGVWGVTSADMEPEGLMARTETALKTQSNYTGWDFTEAWRIDPNHNGGYPYLSIEDNPTGDTPSEPDSVPDEYRINAITLHDAKGKQLSDIQKGSLLATVSLTKLIDGGDTLVILASYSAGGQYQGILYLNVSGVPAGATVEFTLPVDNSGGKIAQLKAFPIASFSDPTPLGAAVSYPTQ